jgi:transposase
MKTLTPAQLTRILTLLDEGKSATQISEITGRGLSTISRIRSSHRPSLSKSSGGRPRKLSPSDIHYSI